MQAVRFLHIPKTGGSTLDEALFLQYFAHYVRRRRFVFSGNVEADARRLELLGPEGRRRLPLYLGHSPRITGFADVDALPTITVLREPVARVMSFCQHVSEGKSPTIPPPMSNGSLDLDALLDSGRMQLNNFQARILLGEGSYALPPGDTQGLARRALDVLEHSLTAFGLTEQFKLSMLLFRRQLGWQGWPVYQSRNVRDTSRLVRFEPRHLEKVRALNELDRLIYQGAGELFQRRVAALGDELAGDLTEYEARLAGGHPAFALIGLARQLRALGRRGRRPRGDGK